MVMHLCVYVYVFNYKLFSQYINSTSFVIAHNT